MPLYFASIFILIFAIVVLVMAAKQKSYEMMLGGIMLLFGAVAFIVLMRVLGVAG